MRSTAGCALAVSTALAACTSLADRFERGNAAMSTPKGLAYLVRLSPTLHRALDSCLPPGAKPPSPMMMLVAEVAPSGAASRVRVEPSSDAADCMRERFERDGFPEPPVEPGEDFFPVGLRIDLPS